VTILPRRAMTTEYDAYQELCSYSLAHPAPTFLHQHVVDAFAAQHASETTKPIQVTFALVGLYLHIERNFTGRQVQRAHMALASRTSSWPTLALPARRGSITVMDVLATPAGPDRDRAIDAWCAVVWDAYRDNEPAVTAFLRRHGIL